jgi:hypothetical protein
MATAPSRSACSTASRRCSRPTPRPWPTTTTTPRGRPRYGCPTNTVRSGVTQPHAAFVFVCACVRRQLEKVEGMKKQVFGGGKGVEPITNFLDAQYFGEIVRCASLSSICSGTSTSLRANAVFDCVMVCSPSAPRPSTSTSCSTLARPTCGSPPPSAPGMNLRAVRRSLALSSRPLSLSLSLRSVR